jgi:hypothetical protein
MPTVLAAVLMGWKIAAASEHFLSVVAIPYSVWLAVTIKRI